MMLGLMQRMDTVANSKTIKSKGKEYTYQVFNLSCGTADRKRIEDLAKKLRKPMSFVIRRAIKEMHDKIDQ